MQRKSTPENLAVFCAASVVFSTMFNLTFPILAYLELPEKKIFSIKHVIT